ncbi:hypothetical protein SODALDRAFT_283280 [Sodiomyces alkalinus F11]|uniref:Gfd2/YDR514C-like C-terminal domain-containing protein n=1 Tax=Sodiomyces alkalinus (strain CBS 110278 / VKM F-3762 / F11) TaxID=1314773 RepID=A0A3N2PMQ6_SODAK|nr:hypothetical protein SODALDRAFT_283280 [Sodiomyces alkalinus F11]ROT35694.1 hypothetical protein SODALDRAFT_283280 [Sodiomyces alkalinus F11]
MKSKKSGSSYGTYTPLPPSSCNPDPAKAQLLLKEEFPDFCSLEIGELSEEGTNFVSWDLAATPLFERIFEGHVWDFFYIYNPKDLPAFPKLFVPTKQFSHFLEFVNATLGIVLTIPEGPPSQNFFVHFGAQGTLRPRYLGRCASQSEFLAIKDRVPPVHDQDVCAGASPDSIASLLEKLRLVEKSSRKSKVKTKKQTKAAEQRRESLHLVQRCLGLRPAARGHSDPNDSPLALDIHGAVPYGRDMDVVFASIDIEVAEQSHKTVLEVGISTFDSRRIVDAPPGDTARNWMPFIQSHHLRVYDYRFMCNTKYVKGCPDNFNFGYSEMPKLANLADRILAILSDCNKPDHDETAPEENRQQRPLILVGHGITADIGFLANMNVDPVEMKGFVQCIDTQDMDRAWRSLTASRSLGTVLNDLDLAHSNLHNAGNDAAYTLQAMLGLAVSARLSELDEAKTKT